MSVDWVAVKAALTEFAKRTNVIGDDVQIHFAEEAKPHMVGDYLWLTISDERAIGSDDIEDVLIDEGQPSERWVSRITGIREFVCAFEFRSRSAKGARAARSALETIRASLEHPVRTQPLADAHVGFLSSDPITSVRTDHDQRKESIAVLNVRFSAFSELLATDPIEAEQRTEAIEVTLQLEGETVAVALVPEP